MSRTSRWNSNCKPCANCGSASCVDKSCGVRPRHGTRFGGYDPHQGLYADGYDDEGAREVAMNVRSAAGDALGRFVGKKPLDMEQWIMLGLEISFMLIFLSMTAILFSDQITSMSETRLTASPSEDGGPSYSLGSGPDPVAQTFDAAQQWYIFYTCMAIISSMYLIAVVVFHFVNRPSVGVKWTVHTRHYITAFSGNVLFRILVCSMMAAFMARTNDDVTSALETEYLANTQEASEATTDDAKKLVYLTSGGVSKVLEKAQAEFSNFQSTALVLFIIMIPRFVSLLGRIAEDADDHGVNLGKMAVGESIDDGVVAPGKAHPDAYDTGVEMDARVPK